MMGQRRAVQLDQASATRRHLVCSMMRAAAASVDGLCCTAWVVVPVTTRPPCVAVMTQPVGRIRVRDARVDSGELLSALSAKTI
jgi:hypothetical protein